MSVSPDTVDELTRTVLGIEHQLEERKRRGEKKRPRDNVNVPLNPIQDVSPTQGKKDPRKSARISCDHCGGKSHMSSDCWQFMDSKGICGICKLASHKDGGYRRCPNRPSGKRFSGGKRPAGE
jgi:hypothetical protein